MKLVRDGAAEDYDPPSADPPKKELVEVRHAQPSDGSDLRRADDPSAGDLRAALRYGLGDIPWKSVSGLPLCRAGRAAVGGGERVMLATDSQAKTPDRRPRWVT
jgi:hypothetical protein